MVETAGDSDRIVEARNDDERADGVGEVVEEHAHTFVGICGAVNGEENHANFKERRGLAEKTRREWPIPLNDQNDSRYDKQQDVTADHQNRQPPADFLS